MKQYLTNEIIKYKNEYINQVFYIEKGIIKEEKTDNIYQEHTYLFLEFIFLNTYTQNNYIAKTRVTGYWINKNELNQSHIQILAQENQKQKKHIELLKINDPIIKISRYLLYQAQETKSQTIYIQPLKELSIQLNLCLNKTSSTINYLIHQNIISKHNKLIKILNIKKLEDNAYLLDY